MDQYNETMMDIDDVLEVQSSIDGMDDDILHDIPNELSNDQEYPGTASRVHRMTDTERPHQTTSNMDMAGLVVEGMPVEQPTPTPGTTEHNTNHGTADNTAMDPTIIVIVNILFQTSLMLRKIPVIQPCATFP
jgi:hypothetical protein